MVSLLTFCSAKNSGLLLWTTLPRASSRSCSLEALPMSNVSSFMVNSWFWRDLSSWAKKVEDVWKNFVNDPLDDFGANGVREEPIGVIPPGSAPPQGLFSHAAIEAETTSKHGLNNLMNTLLPASCMGVAQTIACFVLSPTHHYNNNTMLPTYK